ncbi:MAG: hypothetical protein LBC58_05400, partial [Clostridiales Family XIII bacterium]|nr:hypothetical protein [Clostridiales Family XIII bacterium]
REDEFLRECGAGAGKVIFLARGDVVGLDGPGGSVTARVVYPLPDSVPEPADGEEIDENAASLLLKLDYEGVTALMTADLGFPAEEAVLALAAGTEALRADILKAGHHGSKYSTSDEFLAAVQPRICVVQCGRNTFGHPTRETLEKLHANGIMVQRNDLDGAVMFDIKNGRISGSGTCGKTGWVTRL